MMRQGEPKAHAERRGFQNRGWEKAGWEGFSSLIPEIAATASEQQGNSEALLCVMVQIRSEEM
jgi:hypothetical protein